VRQVLCFGATTQYELPASGSSAELKLASGVRSKFCKSGRHCLVYGPLLLGIRIISNIMQNNNEMNSGLPFSCHPGVSPVSEMRPIPK
jgi:hypothetical protein